MPKISGDIEPPPSLDNRRRTFVTGDVHGNIVPLIKLLQKAGALNSERSRIDPTQEIIIAGDVGHNGEDQHTYADQRAYELLQTIIDAACYGNHDYVVLDEYHDYVKYSAPAPATREAFENAVQAGKFQFAYARYGHLITHAGIHPELAVDLSADAEEAAAQINASNPDLHIIRAIAGGPRGGFDEYGGVLWRDYAEPISDKWPQIFGHSQGRKVRCKGVPGLGTHYCIDIGSHKQTQLAGIWLPSCEIVIWNKYQDG